MATSETLAQLYNDIKSYTAQLGIIYDKIEYVKRTGKLPEQKAAPTPGTMDIYQVKQEIRKLNDLISKTRTKLKPSAKPKNPNRVQEWELKLDQAELQRAQLLEQKKRLEHE